LTLPETVNRSDYQRRRRDFLRKHVDLSTATGLEFGGFDLPTVPPDLGSCGIADVRSEHHLATEFGIPLSSVAPVDYVIEPALAAHRQIRSRFDYLILCHVLEHIPDVITTLRDLPELLNPGGVVFIALPDKRETPDGVRSSTTIARLVERYVEGAKRPSMSEIAEFSLAWDETYQRQYERSMADFFHEVRSQQLFGEPDVHCNVWRDDEFVDQLERLIGAGYLGQVEIVDREPTSPPFNEFYVLLRRPPSSSAEESAVREQGVEESVFHRTCNFCGRARFAVWKRLHAPFPEKLHHDSVPDPDIGRQLSLQYLTCLHCDLSSINPLPRFEIVDRHRFRVGDVLSRDGDSVDRLIGDCERVIETVSEQYEFERYRKTGRLLDVSCGPGIALSWLRDRRGWEVRGVEPAREFVDFAAERFGLEVFQGLAQDLPDPPGSFDVVMMDSSLQYMFDPLGVLLACHRLLREGGCLFLHVPNRDALSTKWTNLNVHWGHWFSFSVSVLDRILTRMGFRSERIFSVQGTIDPRVMDRLPAGFDKRAEGFEVFLNDSDEVRRYLDEAGLFQADFFGLSARKLGPSELDPDRASISRQTLAEIARFSHRPRHCVAIDPDTDVYWPWERERPSGPD